MHPLSPSFFASIWSQRGRVERSLLYMLISIILATLIFILDSVTPLDSVVSLAYSALVLIALGTRSTLAIGLSAALATVLTVGGYFLSPAPVAPLETVLLNHVFAVCAIWLTAILSYLYLRSKLTLQPLAERDQLTQSYNRHYLIEKAREHIEMWRRYRMPLSLIILDIDHFKKINDTYGHSAGDQILKHLARLLQQYTRHVDTVCRYGGEEFVILLPMVSLDEALTTARRIQHAIAQRPVRWETVTLRPTVSMGVAELGDEQGGIEDLIVVADKALYQAKALGRNRIMPLPTSTTSM